MKCEICGRKIETTFLNKVVGTVARDAKGKKKTVCNECQKKYSATKIKEML
jgi:ribosome-binding protein aMBF1 (putative translation factor)